MNQLFTIKKITAALVVSSMAGIVAANSPSDIEQRIKQIGRINIQAANIQITAAPAEASTATATSTPMTETSADAPITTATSTPAIKAPAGLAAGSAIDVEALYNGSCMACHATGAAGAPIVGQAEAWAARIAKGEAALIESAINGVEGTTMMPRGTSTYSDEELAAIVSYMVAKSQ